jgi:hypothetical protein
MKKKLEIEGHLLALPNVPVDVFQEQLFQEEILQVQVEDQQMLLVLDSHLILACRLKPTRSA